MFKKESTNEAGTQETVIAHGVKVEGEFNCQGNITVQGEVHGTVRTEGDLNVGDQARIIANVWAENAIVSGEVQGNMKIAGRLELGPTSRVTGDLEVKTFTMSPGAILNGRCSMPGGLEVVNLVPDRSRRLSRSKATASSVEIEEPQLS